MKKQYLNIMEKAFACYSDDAIKAYTQKVFEEGVREHGFPRLSANLAILIANGRQMQYKDEAAKMMAFCCEEMVRDCHPGQGNDFSVQELVLAIMELEAKAVYPKAVTDGFRASLAQIDPLRTYDCIAADETTYVHNWAAFNACSEWMRVASGICKREDAIDYIDKQIATQLLAIDDHFMYRDPHEPMYYDMIPRKIFATMIYFGYDGRHRNAIEEVVEKSAEITLGMQSVTGEMPFGGRSNQFIHNEACLAAIMEFYAAYFDRKGNRQLAGMCKSSAALAAESMEEWLNRTPDRHVKNLYAPESNGFGCEDYAYFDKYMITAASFCYQAYVFADDSIEKVPCPAEKGRGILKTSAYFHKLFMRQGDYQLEFDLKADTAYDGSGLGRVHKKGVPGPLCLSVPFPGEKPNYHIGNVQKATAFCSCMMDANPSDAEAGYRIVSEEVHDDHVSVTLEVAYADDTIVTEKYTLCDSGVEIAVWADQYITYHVPVFRFDGKNDTDIRTGSDGRTITVKYEGHECEYHCEDAVFTDTGRTLANRNGLYKSYTLGADHKINLKITLR